MKGVECEPLLDHSKGFELHRSARGFADTTTSSTMSAVLRWRAGSAPTAAVHPLSRASSGPWDMEQVQQFGQGTGSGQNHPMIITCVS